MKNEEIKSLYRYAPFNKWAIQSIIEKTIWYPSASQFNDPFDCKLTTSLPDIKKSHDDLTAKFMQHWGGHIPVADDEVRIHQHLTTINNTFYAKSLNDFLFRMQKEAQEIDQIIQKYYYDFGILCLSETPASILMWSHYAANHTGVCMEFERTPENKLGKCALPIEYRNDRNESNDVNGLIFRKYEGWSYEKEWRILERNANALHPFPGGLLSITCGAKMDSSTKSFIQNLVDLENGQMRHKIRVLDAEMCLSHYQIVQKER